MIAVVVSAEAFRGPLGLGEPVVQPTVVCNLDFVGVQHVRSLAGIDRRCDNAQGVDRQFVVMIEEGDELSRCLFEGSVRRR